MMEKTPTQSVYRAVLNMALVLCVIGLLSMGCAGPGLARPAAEKGADGVVYSVTALEALELAEWAVIKVLPEQKIMKLKKPRLGLLVHEVNQPGRHRYARFQETDYIYELDLFQFMGSSPQGERVTGFTYAIKGNGDLKTGPGKVAQIKKHLAEAFDQTGRAVAVTAVQKVVPGPPKLSTPKALPTPPSPARVAPAAVTPEKKVVQDTPATVTPMETVKEDPDEDVFVKLKKLKELLDKGIITEEEFQMKKKELLERI